jgi:hypothetical protein
MEITATIMATSSHLWAGRLDVRVLMGATTLFMSVMGYGGSSRLREVGGWLITT